MHNINWDDLRYVITVANKGSAAAAARVLGVNHSTVVRRIQAFEESQSLRLFDHLPTGYKLTDKGQIFLDAARSIESAIGELERKLVGGQNHLEGLVRITTTDGLYPLITEVLASFQQQYPGISIDLIISNYQLNLKTMDADIAIRPSPDPPSSLVGICISELDFAIYGAETLKKSGKWPEFPTAPWIGLHPPLSESVAGKWMNDTVPDKMIKMRCNSFLTVQGLAEQGVGYAVLPSYLVDKSSALIQIDLKSANLKTKVWLVSHSDILRSKRVSTCMNFLERALKEKTQCLEVGSSP